MYSHLNAYFTTGLIGILVGIGIQDIIGDMVISLWSMGAVFLAFFCAFLRYRSLSVFLILLGWCAIGGILYTAYFQKNMTEKQAFLLPYSDHYASYEGTVQKVMRKEDFSNTYLLTLEQIDDVASPDQIYHLLKLPKNFSLIPGERIGYSGKLVPIEDFDRFSYKKYMLSQHIYFSTTSNSPIKLTPAPETFFLSLFFIRESLLARIHAIFPEYEAIFLGGILFGARENIPQEVKIDFNNSGLTHFIAVSGFNITLCVIFITFLCGFLPAWGRIIAVTLSISLFSVFVGLGAPVVRAALMGILGYMFLQTGNSIKNITLLALVAVIMTALSPLALVYDVSFQLSFLAVIGIMYTQEFLEKIFHWVPTTFAIREAFVLTLAALSFTLPLMIFQFGQVSLLAPFANIAVTWTIPLAMLGGALTVALDIVSHELAVFVGFFEWLLLHYDMRMVYFFGNQEWAVLELDFGVYQYYLEILYFLLLLYGVILYHLKKQHTQSR